MSTAKHTPGPWRFERQEGYEEQCRILKRPVEDHGGYFRHNDGSWTVMDADGELTAPIANVSFRGKAKRGQEWDAPDPEGQANARLIAAAPDLLESAKRTVSLIATVRNICGDKTAEWLMEQESYKLSVAAIAKAEGGAR